VRASCSLIAYSEQDASTTLARLLPIASKMLALRLLAYMPIASKMLALRAGDNLFLGSPLDSIRLTLTVAEIYEDVGL
jgi:hypothetical protein